MCHGNVSPLQVLELSKKKNIVDKRTLMALPAGCLPDDNKESQEWGEGNTKLHNGS